MAAARKRAPKSLKAQVGPWKSSRRRTLSSRRRRTNREVQGAPREIPGTGPPHVRGQERRGNGG